MLPWYASFMTVAADDIEDDSKVSTTAEETKEEDEEEVAANNKNHHDADKEDSYQQKDDVIASANDTADGDDNKNDADDNKNDVVPSPNKNSSDDDDNDDTPPPSKNDPSPSRTIRRERKATLTLLAESFRSSEPQRSIQVQPGRGKRLEDLPSTLAILQQASDNELENLHKLLFIRKHGKKPPKEEIMPNILQFSGYLPPLDAHEPKALQAMERENEARISVKIAKLKKAEIIAICDLLSIDRSGIHDKDSLSDVLLTFLAEPSLERIVTREQQSPVATKKKGKIGRPKGSKNKRKIDKEEEDDDDSDEELEDEEEEESEDDDDDDDDFRARRPRARSSSRTKRRASARKKPKTEVDEYNIGGSARRRNKSIDSESLTESLKALPGDTELRRWVIAFLNCYNMEKATIKVALEVASDRFGVDMSSKKETIKRMLAEEL